MRLAPENASGRRLIKSERALHIDNRALYLASPGQIDYSAFNDLDARIQLRDELFGIKLDILFRVS